MATGVSVEVPTQDSVETITLRGEQDKLGPALTMVYSKVSLCLAVSCILIAIHLSLLLNQRSKKTAEVKFF
jgi:hypothetical protein